MTDRPASWRMPTPKQMEKLAAEAARRAGALRCGSGCAAPGRILGIGAQRPSRRRDRRPDAAATSVGNSAPRAARLLPPLRADRRNPDRRCSPTVWRQRGLEGRRAAAARQHLPAAHRQTRRRRVLAGVRDAVACRSDLSASGCPDGAETSPHAPVGRRPQGSDARSSARRAR